MEPLFTGCATALITPFKGGAIDYEALDRLVEEQIAQGVDALVAAGTTGEPATNALISIYAQVPSGMSRQSSINAASSRKNRARCVR